MTQTRKEIIQKNAEVRTRLRKAEHVDVEKKTTIKPVQITSFLLLCSCTFSAWWNGFLALLTSPHIIRFCSNVHWYNIIHEIATLLKNAECSEGGGGEIKMKTWRQYSKKSEDPINISVLASIIHKYTRGRWLSSVYNLHSNFTGFEAWIYFNWNKFCSVCSYWIKENFWGKIYEKWKHSLYLMCGQSFHVSRVNRIHNGPRCKYFVYNGQNLAMYICNF
jgi:hypothetical protein